MITTNASTKTRLNQILAQVNTLKPMPGNITRALQLMDDPDTTVHEVASAIALDQALAARILKLANSAYYGFVHPASTLHQAITRLGFRRTKTVLYTVSYSSQMSRKVKGYNLDRNVLWQHSIAVAMIAQKLSERVVYAAPDEAYIAGLLHDIGKLALGQHFTINWDDLLAVAQTHNLSLIEAEQYLFELDHAQVGGALAHKWNLPLCLVDAIAYHHRPDFAPASPKLAAIIHLADLIALRLGVGLAHEAFLPNPLAEALTLLDINPYELDDLTQSFTSTLESLPLLDKPHASTR